MVNIVIVVLVIIFVMFFWSMIVLMGGVVVDVDMDEFFCWVCLLWMNCIGIYLYW